jgi:homoserine kinase type II
MGVITKLSLGELNSIFTDYNFISIEETLYGVIDTTYTASTKDKHYIIKRYERDIKHKIERDKQLLKDLKSSGLNVPAFLEEKDGWYIYEKLSGDIPKNTHTAHIQALARLLSKLHAATYKKDFPCSFMQSCEVDKSLEFIKTNFYHYYKKLQKVENFNMQNDGLIHGDIFKDNTVFDSYKIGIFDFIDSGYGSFLFDSAVALIGFNVKKTDNYYINMFLNTYNQRAPKKLKKRDLIHEMDLASKFYTLLRIYRNKNIKTAKELL